MTRTGYLFGLRSCHCGCEICSHCSAACLSVTFAGWSGTGAANCDCADLNGTYLLTRGKARRVAINVSTATGSGAILWAVLGWDNATATHYVDGVDIEDGGTGYDPADTASVDVSSGEVVCDETPEVSLTISGGVVVGATVDTPGKLVLSNDPCVYSACMKFDCDSDGKSVTVSLEITDTSRVLTVAVRGETITTGTIDAEDNPCDDMTFEAGDFTGECTAGTATVSAGECDGPPSSCCGPCDGENACPDGCECIDGWCHPLRSCCGWSCDYVLEMVWPDIENPEDVPDVSAELIAAGWILEGIQWRKVIPGEVNCDDVAVSAAKEDELEGEVDGIIGGMGGFSIVSIDPMVSGFGCFDDLPQDVCEGTYAGTYRNEIPCFGNPFVPCEEDPFP